LLDDFNIRASVQLRDRSAKKMDATRERHRANRDNANSEIAQRFALVFRADRFHSGPKKGTKYAPTLAREAAEAHYRARVAERFDRMIDAQMETAAGIKEFVYRDEAGRFKVIDDPDELQARINLGQAIEIFARLPSTQAQTDMLNRLMGRAKEQPKNLNISSTLNVVDILRQRHARGRRVVTPLGN
jgi:hypothetical protein